MSDEAPTVLETTANAVARGVGHVVVGPMFASAIEAPEMRAAVNGYLVKLALGVGLGVAAGVLLGFWLGRR